MVAIYVLKLSRGKYYVGLTRRNIDRVLDHIDGKGAAWTKKYPPSNSKPILSFQEGLKVSDEDKITLETMKRYGVKNVRGGSWCKVNMTQNEIRALEVKIAGGGKKTVPQKKVTKTKSSPKKSPTCSRCGREGHNRTKCYAKTTVDGVNITTKSWTYRPKSELGKKKRDYDSEQAVLNSPFGHPFQVNKFGRLVRDKYGRAIRKK